MSLALFGAGVSGRLPQRSNIFCAVVILLLCYEPRWLWDAGFQLSFTTTAGLLYFYPVLSGLCTPVTYLWGIAEILAVSFNSTAGGFAVFDPLFSSAFTEWAGS